MQKVKITAVRKACYSDLSEKYENPLENACCVAEGQTWISETGASPTAFATARGRAWRRSWRSWHAAAETFTTVG